MFTTDQQKQNKTKKKKYYTIDFYIENDKSIFHEHTTNTKQKRAMKKYMYT